MLLEKPDELVPLPDRFEPTRWFFAGWKRAPLAAFLSTCGIPAGQQATLLASPILVEQADGCLVTPPTDLILSLAPEGRAKIYAELEKSPVNVFHQNPFRIRSTDAEQWFSHVGLSQSKVDLATKLTYRRGGALCFCDLEVASHYFPPDELRALIRALYSSDTLLLSLRIRPGDPVEKIAAYWGRNGRESTLKALLKSIERIPDGAELDVSQLMPPLPRAWLNTYPQLARQTHLSADCYWTALNFFRVAPDDRVLEPRLRSEDFSRNYTVVAKPEQLGDVIVFVDAKDVTQHACVFIAGDIVFTKNGARPSLPWVFMRLDEVRALYNNGAPMRAVVFRPHST